ncbi:MAG TPA: histidine kinase, partial [Actinomycetes bacterium]|nr:histidine kinase [Actinomycetes bacterium]
GSPPAAVSLDRTNHHPKPHITQITTAKLLGWLLVTVGLCQATQQALAAYGGYGVAMADPPWPLATQAALVAAGLWFPGLAPLFNLLPALYPNGRLASRWWRWPVGAAALGIVLMMVALILSPGGYDDVAPGRPPLTSPTISAVCFIAGAPLLIAGTLVIWAGSMVRLVRARPPERQQLAWLLVVIIPWVVLSFFIGANPLFEWFGLLLPVAIAVGVLRYRLLGIEVVVRRGLVYGALTAAVVGVYLLVTTVAGARLDPAPLPGVVAAALVAVGLTPLRDRLQTGVDRLVYGDRRDPMRAVTRLGDRMAAAGEPDLLPTVLATVTDAVRAPGAAVVAPDGSVLAVHGAEPAGGNVEQLGLRVGGRDLGKLRIAPRTPEEPYGDGDRRLLAALAPQVAVVVRALELAEALEAERDRVVAATRQERDRLRRDLHDGLGPSLSGVGLGLQALQDAQAVSDAAASEQLLGRIREEVATAVGEVRRILEDLRPAVLDRTRLPDAVRQHASTIATGQLDVSVNAAQLPPVPADVEAAAYRIIQEALTNVVRHADAHHAHITLAASDSTLIVEVADDGHGIRGQGRDGAVGLASMRQRAEVLQGSLRVDTGDRGTTVVATLPLGDGGP